MKVWKLIAAFCVVLLLVVLSKHILIVQTSPGPKYPPKPKIGGCAGTRYGCCLNNYTPKVNEQGSNCLLK